MVENALATIVGNQNYSDDPRVLKEFASDGSFTPSRMPAGLVKPGSVEEVMAVVKWANETHTPLVPVSSGTPRFRGDTVPGSDGAIIVDLRRMNKIIRVDNVNRVALVEPGVTFGELEAALNQAGMCSYMPLAPRSNKSVISSILEREPITMPGLHFDSTDPMLCAEIVFGSGDKMRTGEAAGPDSLEKQWEIGKAQMSPFGPTQMDPQRLVSGAQGTIGIVTWMSMKTRYQSEINKYFLIPSDTLEPLIELMYKLTRFRFTGKIFILNNLNLACLMRNTPVEIDNLRTKLPACVLFVSCEGYGPLPEDKIKYIEDDLMELANEYCLKPVTSLSGVAASDVAKVIGKPSSEPYWKQRFQGSFDEVLFLTTQGKTPEFARTVFEYAHLQNYPVNNIGVYLQPVAQGTSCHTEFDIYFDPKKPGVVHDTRRFVEQLADKLDTRGAYFSRPYRELAAAAYRRAADTAEMQKRVKQIFDPNSILNPGKLCF